MDISMPDLNGIEARTQIKKLWKDGKILDFWLTASTLNDENVQFVAIAITERDLACLVGTQEG